VVLVAQPTRVVLVVLPERVVPEAPPARVVTVALPARVGPVALLHFNLSNTKTTFWYQINQPIKYRERRQKISFSNMFMFLIDTTSPLLRVRFGA
jgi:hypothetical protein